MALPHIERLLRATQGANAPANKRILEINPTHPIIQNLKTLLEQDENHPKVQAWVELLYGQALIAEGSPLEDPGCFTRGMTELLTEISSQLVGTSDASN